MLLESPPPPPPFPMRLRCYGVIGRSLDARLYLRPHTMYLPRWMICYGVTIQMILSSAVLSHGTMKFVICLEF